MADIKLIPNETLKTKWYNATPTTNALGEYGPYKICPTHTPLACSALALNKMNTSCSSPFYKYPSARNAVQLNLLIRKNLNFRPSSTFFQPTVSLPFPYDPWVVFPCLLPLMGHAWHGRFPSSSLQALDFGLQDLEWT